MPRGAEGREATCGTVLAAAGSALGFDKGREAAFDLAVEILLTDAKDLEARSQLVLEVGVLLLQSKIFQGWCARLIKTASVAYQKKSKI